MILNQVISKKSTTPMKKATEMIKILQQNKSRISHEFVSWQNLF